MPLLEVKDSKTLEEVLNSTYKLIVIDIYADWCEPCKYLAPILEKLSDTYKSANILFIKINADTGLKTNLKGFPCIEFWLKQGAQRTLVQSVLGADVPQIESTLKQLTASTVNPKPTTHSTNHEPNNNPQGFRYKNSSRGGGYKTFSHIQ
jgi:thiol-disulfide isomerase/thioredoxin